MKAATKERKVLVYSPKEKGVPLKSIKTGRNTLCYCGSGLKQKKCHGERQMFN